MNINSVSLVNRAEKVDPFRISVRAECPPSIGSHDTDVLVHYVTLILSYLIEFIGQI